MCRECGLWYSNRGIIPHTRNCPRDEPLLDPFRPPEEGGLPADHHERPDPQGDPHADSKGVGRDDGGDPSVGSSHDPSPPTEDVATDGGPGLPLSGPPETTSPTSRADRDKDLPDRYVPVEEYLAAVEEETHNVDVEALREHLAEYDVVDVQATSAEHISAHTLEEVSS